MSKESVLAPANNDTLDNRARNNSGRRVYTMSAKTAANRTSALAPNLTAAKMTAAKTR